ncbi:MAG TPA: hypothetical protein VGR96_11330 [Acidobacteriaceae bacterium]|nr:hypothetical protein [Acidobacteriaceae bacterium]
MKHFVRVLKFLIVFSLLLYAADWSQFEIRMQRNSGLGSIEVEKFLATRLKGEKEEFDYLGTGPQVCARSIFPHDGNPPCWWVERHKTEWVQ